MWCTHVNHTLFYHFFSCSLHFSSSWLLLHIVAYMQLFSACFVFSISVVCIGCSAFLLYTFCILLYILYVNWCASMLVLQCSNWFIVFIVFLINTFIYLYFQLFCFRVGVCCFAVTSGKWEDFQDLVKQVNRFITQYGLDLIRFSNLQFCLGISRICLLIGNFNCLGIINTRNVHIGPQRLSLLPEKPRH